MEFKKQISSEDRAVSPVIGVILMVAITVILAAVIGAFVLGLGDQMGQNAPQATFSANYDDSGANDILTITHTGGNTLDADTLSIAIEANSGGWTDNIGDLSEDTMTTGESITVEDDGSGDGLDLSSATVRLVWTSADGGSSQTLFEWDGPQP